MKTLTLLALSAFVTLASTADACMTPIGAFETVASCHEAFINDAGVIVTIEKQVLPSGEAYYVTLEEDNFAGAQLILHRLPVQKYVSDAAGAPVVFGTKELGIEINFTTSPSHPAPGHIGGELDGVLYDAKLHCSIPTQMRCAR